MTVKSLVFLCLAGVAVVAALLFVRRYARARSAQVALRDSATGSESGSPLHDPVRKGVRAFMRAHYEEAFELLEPAANAGNLKAQQLLAKMYFAGHGVSADRERYLYWLKRAADNGDKPSKAKVKKLEAGNIRTS